MSNTCRTLAIEKPKETARTDRIGTALQTREQTSLTHLSEGIGEVSGWTALQTFTGVREQEIVWLAGQADVGSLAGEAWFCAVFTDLGNFFRESACWTDVMAGFG